ncbi:MAG: hypothetical protein Q9227_008458 [Pyrenula ochraceoflavens]
MTRERSLEHVTRDDNSQVQDVAECLQVNSLDPTQAEQQVTQCLKDKGISLDQASHLKCSKKRKRSRGRKRSEEALGKRAVKAAAELLKRHGKRPQARQVISAAGNRRYFHESTKTIRIRRNGVKREELSDTEQAAFRSMVAANPAHSSAPYPTAFATPSAVGSIPNVPDSGGTKEYGMTMTCEESVGDAYMRIDFFKDKKNELCSTLAQNLEDFFNEQKHYTASASGNPGPKPTGDWTSDQQSYVPQAYRATGDGFQNVKTSNLNGLQPVFKDSASTMHGYIVAFEHPPDPKTWLTDICGPAIDAMLSDTSPCTTSEPLSSDSTAGENHAVKNGFIEFTSDGKPPQWKDNADGTESCTNCSGVLGWVAPDKGKEDLAMINDDDFGDVPDASMLANMPLASDVSNDQPGFGDECDADESGAPYTHPPAQPTAR